MPVHPCPICCGEDGSFGAFPDGEIDGAGGARRHWDDDGLAAFATDPQRVVSSFEADIGDVGAEGFRDTQPVQCEEACQGVIAGTGQSGLDQEGAELVSIQAKDGRLVT